MIQIGDFATVRKAKWGRLTAGQRGRVGVVVAVDMAMRRATIIARYRGGQGKRPMRISAPIDAFDIVERPKERMGLAESLYHAQELEK